MKKIKYIAFSILFLSIAYNSYAGYATNSDIYDKDPSYDKAVPMNRLGFDLDDSRQLKRIADNLQLMNKNLALLIKKGK